MIGLHFPMSVLVFIPPFLFYYLIGSLIVVGMVIHFVLMAQEATLKRSKQVIYTIQTWLISLVLDAGCAFIVTCVQGLFFLPFLTISLTGAAIFAVGYWLFPGHSGSKLPFQMGLALGGFTAPWMFLLQF